VDHPIETSEPEYRAARKAALARKVEAMTLDDPRSDLFHYGEGLGLIGQPTSVVRPKRIAGIIDSPNVASLREVNLDSGFIPVQLVGTVRVPGRDPEALHLAISVNGRIQNLTRPYRTKQAVRFDTILSDAVFRQGRNDVDIFLIDLADFPEYTEQR
jgi:hypothetical protein